MTQLPDNGGMGFDAVWYADFIHHLQGDGNYGDNYAKLIHNAGFGSPAAKAGIVAGDIILSAGNLPAVRYGAIARQLGANAIGKKIALAVARAGAVVNVDVTVEARTA